MELPVYVREVIDTLRENGKPAWLVGGGVRDLLMGQKPVDYDVVTAATTGEIRAWFGKTVPVGEKHGTIAVLLGGGTVEVSTLKGTANPVRLADDLLRRDFTINAMAVDEQGNIIDPYGGLVDIKNRLIRSPEDLAGERFQEDPLRMMRAIRFCVAAGYSLHPNVYEAIRHNSGELNRTAPERIRAELNRILVADRPAHGIILLLETGLLQQFLPEVVAMVGFDQKNKRHNKDVFEHTLAVLEAAPARINVRLAGLLHDIAKPNTFTISEDGIGHFYGHHLEGRKMSEEILRRLKYDNQTIEDVSILVAEHMSRFPKVRNANLKRLINRAGERNLEDLFDLQRADILGSAPPFDFADLDNMMVGVTRIINEKPPLTVKDLAINGHDLIGLGIKPGPYMGQILRYLMDVVLEKPDKNDNDVLLELAEDYINQIPDR